MGRTKKQRGLKVLPSKQKKGSSAESLTLTITPVELAELRSRHQLKHSSHQAYRAAAEFLAVYQRQLASAYALPAQYEVDLSTGVVTWHMTPGERGRRAN